MDDCLSRIIVQSIKDELGHWDELKEEQCESEFVYLSAEEVQQEAYQAAGRDDVYPTEGCASLFPPPSSDCDPLNGTVKREWGAGPNPVIKQECPDDVVPFHKNYGASSPDQLTDASCWNGGFHPPCHPPVEYIELKPKVRYVSELSPAPGTAPSPATTPDHRPELAYVLLERLPLRVIQAWLPAPPIDRLALMRGKRRHSSLTLETKLKILRDVGRASLAKKDIARKYEIPQSTLSTLIRNRNKIEDSFLLGAAPGRYRARGAKHKEVEAKLFEYFTNVRSQNVYVSGQMLQEEAGRIATRMRVDDFAASSGWLWRFQKRYNISPHSPPPAGGNEADSPTSTNDLQEEWLRSVHHLLDNYSARDTFAADEVALYYNATPDRTASLGHARCHGGERSKDRLTVALACNADGSEKLRPLVVGKFGNPRCFGRVGDRATMPCVYRSSKRSWMTGLIFSEWLATVQRRMERAGRKILLVVDNCKAHALDGAHHPNVRVLLLPPDVAHPLGGGVGHAFKRAYRQRLLRHYLHQVRAGVGLASLRKWDTLDAIVNIAASWGSVSPSTIRRGWAGSRLVGDAAAGGEREGDGGGEEWDLTPSQLAELGVSNFDAIVRVDDDVSTSCMYEGGEGTERAASPPPPPPPAPTRDELACAVGVFGRVAATCRVPAKVARAIRVLDRYVADIVEPSPAQRDVDAWSRQTV